MPYIKKIDRIKYNNTIDKLCHEFEHHTKLNKIPVGDMNYVFSTIVNKLFDEHPSYQRANDLVGMLECVKQEFIRRKVNPYEDEKIHENGDI
jgi:hypothetical protein